MARESEVMEARQRLKDDFEYYARNCLSIRTKHEGLQPLVLNQAQEYIHGRLQKQLKENGTTVMVITHRPNILFGVDKILVMKDGQAADFGPAEMIMR